MENFSIMLKKIAKRLKDSGIPARISFIFLGILSTAWFLIRVIPKPSRAGYPCMQAAAPFASGFVLYLLSLTSGVFFLKRAWHSVLQKKLWFTAAMIAAVAVSFSLALWQNNFNATAAVPKIASAGELPSNDPIGKATGLHPGRVVWVWDPDATNENMSNSEGDYWFMDKNVNQEVIDAMLEDGVTSYSGTEDLHGAWEEIFRYFNKTKGKGSKAYQKGEKIFIKINLTNSSAGVEGTKRIKNFERMDQTPQFVLSLLKQLVEVVGVEQSDIYCGDTYRTFHDVYWDVCHPVFPDVNYIDGLGINGREQSTPSTEDKLFFSDGKFTSRLPKQYLSADYFINLSCLKSHGSSGITFGAKNHIGSYLPADQSPEEQSAGDLHYCFPADKGYEGHGKYRHLVDLMGHETLGGNTLIYIVDGLWAGKNWNGIMEKWNMEPFYGDYPSSIFLSQDPVAIECVGYDFLLEEYKDKPEEEKFPYYKATNDYLLQAASKEYWPEGITYDPEKDGTPLTSLGVYEHWNNASDKHYSRNLNSGKGIELVKILN